MIDHCDGGGRTRGSYEYDPLQFVYFVTEHGTLFEELNLPIPPFLMSCPVYFTLQFRYRTQTTGSRKNIQLKQLVNKLYLTTEFVMFDKTLKLNYFASEKTRRRLQIILARY